MNKEQAKIIAAADYSTQFWNAARGGIQTGGVLGEGKSSTTGGYFLPTATEDKYGKAIQKESVLRNLATVVHAYKGEGKIFAKNFADIAAWVPDGAPIPLGDGDNAITYSVDSHKLAIVIKLDTDFVYDRSFDLEDYLTERLAKSFAAGEDSGFLHGTGVSMPTGILDTEKGAEVGVTTAALTYDDVIRLYFSLDADFRKDAIWLMNDETALTLRTLKNASGDYLWNQANDTILGKPVVLSKDMPSAADGKMPILFGNFRYYWIVCRSPVSLNVLKERFIIQNQIGYLAYELLDGILLRRDAIKALKMGQTS